MAEMLNVCDVRKTFKLSAKQQKINKTKEKKKVAVNGISFSSMEGEIFGLIGPNGAGKTTTLRMIATLIKPDSGNITVDGISVLDNPEKVRATIGFMTSELKLEEFFTPNYLFDYFCELRGMDKATIEKRKNELFTRFGIDEFKEVKIADLSTGMKQKVSLVISIAHDPKFVIFDEPTNGLDVITAKVVTDFLLELKKEGKSIILSTHIFDLAERLCDRVGMIVDGKMVCVGTLDEIRGGKTLEESFFEIYERNGGEY